MKKSTQIITAGRRKQWTHGVVNPPVYHASTCLFESLEALDQATGDPDAGLYYGRRGTPTSWSLEAALTELEPGAAGTKLLPSGVAAIVASLMAFLKHGDHALITDSAYEPTRHIAESLLKNMGVEVEYYEPTIGSGIAALMKPNTKVVFCESPGSLTFEVQDLPAIAEAAHAGDAVVILDNTWATPYFFNGFAHGADVTLQALTKYVVGHSDAMLGAVAGNERAWPRLKAMVYRLGQCAGPDDAYLGLRGLRTLEVRLKQHEANALKVAKWLKGHELVSRVLHPALPDCPGHAIWKRDFSGATGLFSFVLKRGERDKLAAMVDDMKLFKMGFSWGGYESLILPARLKGIRDKSDWNKEGPVIRLHIGLEDPDDLIAELDDGLARYMKAIGSA